MKITKLLITILLTVSTLFGISQQVNELLKLKNDAISKKLDSFDIPASNLCLADLYDIYTSEGTNSSGQLILPNILLCLNNVKGKWNLSNKKIELSGAATLDVSKITGSRNLNPTASNYNITIDLNPDTHKMTGDGILNNTFKMFSFVIISDKNNAASGANLKLSIKTGEQKLWLDGALNLNNLLKGNIELLINKIDGFSTVESNQPFGSYPFKYKFNISKLGLGLQPTFTIEPFDNTELININNQVISATKDKASDFRVDLYSKLINIKNKAQELDTQCDNLYLPYCKAKNISDVDCAKITDCSGLKLTEDECKKLDDVESACTKLMWSVWKSVSLLETLTSSVVDVIRKYDDIYNKIQITKFNITGNLKELNQSRDKAVLNYNFISFTNKNYDNNKLQIPIKKLSNLFVTPQSTDDENPDLNDIYKSVADVMFNNVKPIFDPLIEKINNLTTSVDDLITKSKAAIDKKDADQINKLVDQQNNKIKSEANDIIQILSKPLDPNVKLDLSGIKKTIEDVYVKGEGKFVAVADPKKTVATFCNFLNTLGDIPSSAKGLEDFANNLTEKVKTWTESFKNKETAKAILDSDYIGQKVQKFFEIMDASKEVTEAHDKLKKCEKDCKKVAFDWVKATNKLENLKEELMKFLFVYGYSEAPQVESNPIEIGGVQLKYDDNSIIYINEVKNWDITKIKTVMQNIQPEIFKAILQPCFNKLDEISAQIKAKVGDAKAYQYTAMALQGASQLAEAALISAMTGPAAPIVFVAQIGISYMPAQGPASQFMDSMAEKVNETLVNDIIGVKEGMQECGKGKVGSCFIGLGKALKAVSVDLITSIAADLAGMATKWGECMVKEKGNLRMQCQAELAKGLYSAGGDMAKLAHSGCEQLGGAEKYLPQCIVIKSIVTGVIKEQGEKAIQVIKEQGEKAIQDIKDFGNDVKNGFCGIFGC